MLAIAPLAISGYFGDAAGRTLLRDEEYQTIVQRHLAFPNLNEELKWMED